MAPASTGGTIAIDQQLAGFAAEAGGVDAGPVCAVGGRTQWSVGGTPAAGVREVRAPSGVVHHEPAEMIVRVRAGTTVAELDAALGEHGQMTVLDAADPQRATVGGALAVGHSGLRRLRWGPVRDTVLEARFVNAEGRVVKAGGPVVKNVSGFDLCRLLVGSLGTIGLLGEVVLRAVPRPQAARWLRADGADPFATLAALHRPSSVLWDGTTTWVLLEGYAADVDAETEALRRAPGGAAWPEVAGPPPIPTGGRLSLRPGDLPALSPRRLETSDPGNRGSASPNVAGGWLAEVGVGVVHTTEPVAEGDRLGVELSAVALHQRIKAEFDPTGRLNPGRCPW